MDKYKEDHLVTPDESKALSIAILFFPVSTLIKYLVGYRTILWVDLAFILVLGILAILNTYVKKNSQVLLKTMLYFILIYIFLSFFIPGFEKRDSTSELIAGVSYGIPLVVFLLMIFIFKRIDQKKVKEKIEKKFDK